MKTGTGNFRSSADLIKTKNLIETEISVADVARGRNHDFLFNEDSNAKSQGGVVSRKIRKRRYNKSIEIYAPQSFNNIQRNNLFFPQV